MLAAPWKGLPALRDRLCQSAQLAAFHSTPVSLAKWKSKWDCKGETGAEKPSKKYERYVVRQKRAQGKKALKDYLLYGKPSHLLDESMNNFANSRDSPRFKTFKKRPHSSSKSRKGEHSHKKCKKDRSQFYNFFHEDHFVHPDNIFEALFGKHPGFTWSYMSWEDFTDPSSRFRWTNGSRRERAWKKAWSESDDERDEISPVGSHADRAALGLPPCGPLNLDDVKTAFRAAALKWHPDKHPGSSQAVAEEKFKLCVNAYSSLCNALRDV